MSDVIVFFLLMFLPPLLVAFVVQFYVPSQKRAKLIGWTGLGWTAAIALMSRTSPADFAGLVLGLLFLLIGGGFLALTGAIVGSELSSLMQLLLRKRSKG